MTIASITGQSWPPVTPVQSVAPASTDSAAITAQAGTTAPASSPVFSPTTHVDSGTGIAVLEELNGQGQIVQQFPSKQAIEEYLRHQGPLAQTSPSSQSITPAQTADGTGSSNGSGQGSTNTTT